MYTCILWRLPTGTWAASRNWCRPDVDVGPFTELVLAICRCRRNLIPRCTFPRQKPRIALIRDFAKKNARTLDFLAFYFWPKWKIYLERRIKNTFVKRDDLQKLWYEIDDFDTKLPTYPMIHYWIFCCNETARSPKITKVFLILSSRQIFHFGQK